MSEDLQFDMALSYSDSDAWLAKDLANLVLRYGYEVYCADLQPDQARGFLRANLREIYRSACVNVVIWSKDYAAKEKDSIVGTEMRLIINRHIEKDDARALFVLAIDGTPPQDDLQEVLFHKLKDIGITGAEKCVLSRLKDLATFRTAGKVCHPTGTEHDRGQLHPCSFFIQEGFQKDCLGRWRRLADVEIRFPRPSPVNTPHVYLIPSGKVMNLLSHTLILESDPTQLDSKRKATIEFVNANRGTKLNGYWFYMKKNDAEV
ncbi:MAG: TIR domain-containing protein, partial [Armatimonadetes bacterium]|nr:TIR domain-containing protein [Armatimonadota bacterium]